MTFEYSLTPQLTNLGRKSASVNLKIIGQLLPVKGDLKAPRPRALGASGKIGQQLFTRGAARGHADFFVQLQ